MRYAHADSATLRARLAELEKQLHDSAVRCVHLVNGDLLEGASSEAETYFTLLGEFWEVSGRLAEALTDEGARHAL